MWFSLDLYDKIIVVADSSTELINVKVQLAQIVLILKNLIVWIEFEELYRIISIPLWKTLVFQIKCLNRNTIINVPAMMSSRFCIRKVISINFKTLHRITYNINLIMHL